MEAAIAAGGALIGDVVDWGWEQLQSLWTEVPALAGEAIVEAGADALAQFAIGSVGEVVNWVTGGIDDIAWIPDFVKSAFTTFAANVGENLGTIATSAIGFAKSGSLEILGVTGAQERYMTELQDSLDTTFDAIATKLQVGQATNWQIGEEGIDNLIDSLNYNVKYSYDQAADFLRSTQIGMSGEMEQVRDWAYNSLGTTLIATQQAGRTAIEMIDKGISGVDTYLNEVVINEAERNMQMLRDTIIIPTANAEAMLWAMKEANASTDEEMKNALKLAIIAMNEVTVEMGMQPEFDPRVTGPR